MTLMTNGQPDNPTRVLHGTSNGTTYLHRDFHGALSAGLDYLADQYGRDKALEYLRIFTRSYYAPLQEAISRHGLRALRDHLDHVYTVEGGDVELLLDNTDTLRINVRACPAVMHMRSRGYSVSPLWKETSRTVYETLCENTPYNVSMLDYDEATGRAAFLIARADTAAGTSPAVLSSST